jgi:hypothetical protein
MLTFAAMAGRRHPSVRESAAPYEGDAGVLAPFKSDAWLRLSPAERLERSWRLRRSVPDLQAVHDRKLFPKP